ncbi:SDR family oxidoreductase [Bdellovibrio bacteriovorus]|uniref:SDR family oxidoreductase n=1 Tax=Bdellovibrio bacteriovorus TaxID=959 RepID=UPI0021D1323E|nr:SDR family oxidoreductase [Bdellovibrio bacteriovorus]UXR63710.1 SDR family oxidoreductase [Bdellovibrio bacteriovorus]
MELRIMVTGATGTMGSELLKILTRQGIDAVAVSRSLERLPAGVRGMQLPFENRYLLEQALRNVDVLAFIQPLCEDMLKQAENVIAAARASGVQFVLKVSGLGASPVSPYLFQRIQGDADEMLQESGLRYCILRPNIYMQCFLKIHHEALMQGILYLPQGEGRTSFVDARDVAEVAAKILGDPWLYNKKTLELTGERALSNAEAVSLIAHYSQRRLAYVPVTDEAGLKLLKKNEENEWMVQALMSLHRATRSGAVAPVTSGLAQFLGREPRSFETFCADMKQGWMLPLAQENLL